MNHAIRDLLNQAERLARDAGDDDTAGHILDVIADMEEREDRRLWDEGRHPELFLREEARRRGRAA